MNFNIVSVILVGGGGILLYGAIKNKNPISVIQEALKGGGTDKAAPLRGTPGPGPTGGTGGTIPSGFYAQPNSPFPPGYPGA